MNRFRLEDREDSRKPEGPGATPPSLRVAAPGGGTDIRDARTGNRRFRAAGGPFTTAKGRIRGGAETCNHELNRRVASLQRGFQRGRGLAEIKGKLPKIFKVRDYFPG